jgi:hypothetical protein
MSLPPMRVEIRRRTFLGGVLASVAAACAPRAPKALTTESDPVERRLPIGMPRSLLPGDTIDVSSSLFGGAYHLRARCSLTVFAVVMHRSGRVSCEDTTGALWPCDPGRGAGW